VIVEIMLCEKVSRSILTVLDSTKVKGKLGWSELR
jgi:hypothetical protein